MRLDQTRPVPEGSFEVAGILERRGVKGIRSGMSASAALKKAGLKEPALRSVALEQALRVEQDVTGSSDGLLLQSACAAYKVDMKKLEDGIRSRLKTEADAGPAGKLAKKKAAKKR